MIRMQGKAGRKQPQAPIGSKTPLLQDGDGHYAKATGPRKGAIKNLKADSVGGRDGKSPAHAYKGGGSGHYGKKIRQTKNARAEKNAMLTGSGNYARNHVGPTRPHTFMTRMVAKKSQIIRGY